MNMGGVREHLKGRSSIIRRRTVAVLGCCTCHLNFLRLAKVPLTRAVRHRSTLDWCSARWIVSSVALAPCAASCACRAGLRVELRSGILDLVQPASAGRRALGTGLSQSSRICRRVAGFHLEPSPDGCDRSCRLGRSGDRALVRQCFSVGWTCLLLQPDVAAPRVSGAADTVVFLGSRDIDQLVTA
jgi:hypothetical protein